MTDQEQKKGSTTITPQPDAENKKESGELTKEELEKASGGWGVGRALNPQPLPPG
jgi:hypothetical protein